MDKKSATCNVKGIIYASLITLSLMQTVMAQVVITNTTIFDTGQSNLTFLPTQTFTNITLRPNNLSYLSIHLNDTYINFSSPSNKTFENLTFSSDTYSWTASGSSDSLNITAKAKSFNITYNFFADSLLISQNISDQHTYFTFENWSTHDFIINISGYKITGFITNKINQPLQFANVSTGAITVVTNSNGYYEFNDIPPGNYTLTTNNYGYGRNRTQINLSSNLSQNVTLNLLGQVIPVGNYNYTYILFSIITLLLFSQYYSIYKSGRKLYGIKK